MDRFVTRGGSKADRCIVATCGCEAFCAAAGAAVQCAHCGHEVYCHDFLTAADAARARSRARADGADCTVAGCDCAGFDYERANLFGACPACRHQERDHRAPTALDAAALKRVADAQRQPCRAPDCRCRGYVRKYGSRLHAPDVPCERCAHAMPLHRDVSASETAHLARIEEAYALPCAARVDAKRTAVLPVKAAERCVAPPILRALTDDAADAAAADAAADGAAAAQCASTDGDDDGGDGDLCECTGFRVEGGGAAALLPFKGLSAAEARAAVAQLACVDCGHALPAHRKRTAAERRQAERAAQQRLWLLQLEAVASRASRVAVARLPGVGTAFIAQPSDCGGGIALRPLAGPPTSDAAAAAATAEAVAFPSAAAPVAHCEGAGDCTLLSADARGHIAVADASALRVWRIAATRRSPWRFQAMRVANAVFSSPPRLVAWLTATAACVCALDDGRLFAIALPADADADADAVAAPRRITAVPFAVTAMAVAPDDAWLCVAGDAGRVARIDLGGDGTDAVTRLPSGGAAMAYGRALCARVHPSGAYAVVAGEDDAVTAVHVDGGGGRAAVRRFARFHRSFVCDVAITAAGRHWITCGWDARVALWGAAWDDVGALPVLAVHLDALAPARLFAVEHALLVVGDAGAAALYGATPASGIFDYAVDTARRRSAPPSGAKGRPARKRRVIADDESDASE